MPLYKLSVLVYHVVILNYITVTLQPERTDNLFVWWHLILSSKNPQQSLGTSIGVIKAWDGKSMSQSTLFC